MANANRTSSSSYSRFVDFDYQPTATDVIASYRVKKNPSSQLNGYAFLGAIAAEASTGTWVEVQSDSLAKVNVSGKVFSYDSERGLAKIAFPLGLFEPGNVSQLLTVVAGNSFGLADLEGLKLLDLSLPRELMVSFPGPKFGMGGIYEKLQIDAPRPIIGAIMKPKCGLTASEHAKLCFDAWVGESQRRGEEGVDMVKDDEALTSQLSFSSEFDERIRRTLDKCREAERLTGTTKIYVPNVTHSNVSESIRRAKLVQREGGRAVMVDYVIGGGVLLHSLRMENLDLIIHGHRTLFAALHRANDFGIHYVVWAKLARAMGVDQVHIGTPGLGVMNSRVSDVFKIHEAISQPFFSGEESGEFLNQNFYGHKACAPICGAGLDPFSLEPLVKSLGVEVILFAGGGVHGHPMGSRAGAASLRAALNAFQSGHSFNSWAEKGGVDYRKSAADFFGTFKRQSPNDAARESM